MGTFKKYTGHIFLFCFLIAISGIYVIPKYGLRIDHIIIYSIAGIIFSGFILNKTPLCICKPVIVLSGCFFAIVLIGVSVNIFSDYTFLSIFNLLAGIENYIQPLALILISSFVIILFDASSINSLLVKAIKAFLLFLVLNTFLSFIIFYLGPGDYLEMIGGSGHGDVAGMTVVERALLGGRNSGVFNQPIEGGVAYALGILFWLYLYKKDNKRASNIWACIQLFIIVIGGILAGSKIFSVVSSVIAIFYLLPIKNYKYLINPAFLITGVLILSIFFTLAYHWPGAIPIQRGFVYFTRLLNVNGSSRISGANNYKNNPSIEKEINNVSENIVNTYTSGRFSGNSNVISRVLNILHASPIYGYGFGTIQTSDNAILDIISISGLLGIMAYLSIFIFIVIFSFQRLKPGNHNSELLLAMWVLIIISSIGAPIITANRISIIIWIVTSLLIFSLDEENVRELKIKNISDAMSLFNKDG